MYRLNVKTDLQGALLVIIPALTCATLASPKQHVVSVVYVFAAGQPEIRQSGEFGT